MFNNMENLKLISSSQGLSKSGIKIVKKTCHGFTYRVSGQAVFVMDGKEYLTKKGDMIFIPKGSSYMFKTLPGEVCRYFAINFDSELKNPSPFVFSMENFTDMDYILNHFVNLWKFGSQSDKYKCYSLFYSLLSYISNMENLDYSAKRKFELIEPAVRYLRDHIFDPSLRADSLHLMCGISDTYFRKIFVAKFSLTPQQYIISKRISHAKSLIDTGNFDTISSLATSVGYDDPLYFSRSFKKKYGISPGNMTE